MPIADGGGGGSGSGSGVSSGGSNGAGSAGSSFSIIQDVLSTAAGALAGAAAAVQLFSTPNAYRTHMLIRNNGAGTLYIGFTSDVSSSKHLYRLAADNHALLAIMPQVNVWIRPDATGNNYTAHEVRVR